MTIDVYWVCVKHTFSVLKCEAKDSALFCNPKSGNVLHGHALLMHASSDVFQYTTICGLKYDT